VQRGLAAGEAVVVDGNFLIDAESNLRAGTESLGHSHDAPNGAVQPGPLVTIPPPAGEPVAAPHSGHGTP
jgi:hypothetical protein